jgi:hypothetical protein
MGLAQRVGLFVFCCPGEVQAMTTIIREYVERATWCETQAKGACDPEFRRSYEELARRWRALADEQTGGLIRKENPALSGAGH